MKAAVVAASLAVLCATGCRSESVPAPSPASDSGGPIDGGEKIGWDQYVGSPAELAALRFAIYVDGTRIELDDASCDAPVNQRAACSARLPPLKPGSRVLELVAFTGDGRTAQSARSASLTVDVR